MGTSVCAEVQPCASVCVIPKTSAPRPAVAVTAPGTSRRGRCSTTRSVSSRAAIARTASPTGTFTSSTQRQDSSSVSAPPTRPPVAPPAAPIAIHQPIARARCGPSANDESRIVSVAGERTAAPSPCTTRPVSRTPEEPASPPTRLPAAKSATPAMKARRWPMTSASRPPSSRKPA